MGTKKKIGILIIDDDLLFYNAVKEHLRDRGYHVFEAENIRQALNWHQEDITLIIIDLNIDVPNDGFGLIQKLKKDHPRSAFIACTIANDGETVRRFFKEYQVSDVLLKDLYELPIWLKIIEEAILDQEKKMQLADSSMINNRLFRKLLKFFS